MRGKPKDDQVGRRHPLGYPLPSARRQGPYSSTQRRKKPYEPTCFRDHLGVVPANPYSMFVYHLALGKTFQDDRTPWRQD
ncbi:hypothetical protein BHM03_00052672 [Ensete ventricosum]|nr:hypothetical protein BHM03_00052672 [Ensete ventricosum]